MKAVDKILLNLERLILTGEQEELETEKLELKDLSQGSDWKELHKSVCAFLNSDGGIVIIGVNEKNRKYKITGYDSNTEPKLKALGSQFTCGEGRQVPELKDHISFKVLSLGEHRLCAVYIDKLPEEKKFVFYKGTAYKRVLTGDEKIKEHELARQKELRETLRTARELQVVEEAEMADLDVNVLNDFIQRLNYEINVETLKPSISDATSFLHRKKFAIGDKPTLLGVLVCAKYPGDLIGGRCQVDGYVESKTEIVTNKKVITDNVISLMEKSIGFVIANTATGITVDKGGDSLPEYPQKLLRETVNNALAHRDYSSNRFVSILIYPNEKIVIKNPGKFKAEQMIKHKGEREILRITPIPDAQNPKLAAVLKTFDRWEGQGRGMAELTNRALENHIDLAYFSLQNPNEISLSIPKGQLLNEKSTTWLRSYGGYIMEKTNGRELTLDQQTVLAYFYKSELLNRMGQYTISLTSDNNHKHVIADLKQWGLITEFVVPDVPSIIYLLDKQLLVTDFYAELSSLYGVDFTQMKYHYKEVLNAIYHLSKFGDRLVNVNASQVGDHIYFAKNDNIDNVKSYNAYKRKVREIVKRLRERQLIVKVDERSKVSNYRINEEYLPNKDLFT